MKLISPTGNKHISIDTDGTHEIFLEDFESGSRDFILTVDIHAHNAECVIRGRVKSNNMDQKNWKISQIFHGKNQIGVLDLKGCAEDNSLLVFDGSGVLERSSRDASIDISEKIILSDEATARALPILTVKTDQVKSASHASSISCVPAELVFYFRARGIEKKVAESLIKEGMLR